MLRRRGAAASTSCTSSTPSSVNAVTQRPEAVRLLPLVVDRDRDEPRRTAPLPLYEFEPEAEAVLDALLPRYISARVFAALLRVGGVGVGGPAAGDEVGHRQRGRADQDATPGRPTRPARPRSPRKSARSSAAPRRCARLRQRAVELSDDDVMTMVTE